MSYNEVDGDLIKLTLAGHFDVIAHGANCFCTMRSGIAPQMAKAFGCDHFPLERKFETTYGPDGDDPFDIPTHNEGNINKLGQIEYVPMGIKNGRVLAAFTIPRSPDIKVVTVVNAYTQYRYGSLHHPDGDIKPVDYDAITLCMRKINHQFKGQHIGLPKIGAGLAGGDWNIIKKIFLTEFKYCQVTVVNYVP